ncbi:hypothetical protein QBC35DRAFT_504146 [Podospora australis]|uniref:Uncharacterized protein n=1 Tax=Podospora australis TaxID=1536484 RepID=A0AAN6WNI4_9PEZI|nr:hypothetical protein QBC35DRAFT_504146 [Podospora australis]
MLGSTYLNRSAAKFSAELPTNIVIHQIDAAPKLIWNSLTESFGLGTAISNQAGYLSLSFRRLERKGGKWGIPSWLDRVSILVPWMNVSGDWTVGPDDPPCPDPWVLACMLRVRYADGRSTPKDWFPYYGRTIRTHFADEEVVLAGVQEMMKRAKHRGAKEVYLGDSSVNEAVLCQLSSPVEKVDGQTTRYHLAVKLLNLSWEHAVEESREYNVPLTDFAVAADLGEINVRDELGAVNGQPPPPEQMGVGVQSPAGQWMGSPAFRERLTLATAKRVDSGWSEGSG